ncbi:aminotransferase class V-fold PLP-dependent enzyme [Arcicella rigui]|uniref:Aminotransferase class V-fold PLP-dependent enzyme n=1 Tax=Arcicella rigui TaxID=797020 RepID=A0ABU5Q7F6_9BACT|nr:aminotransferase class V-fold PLP-dependent enzyme [Arcicella rigui]MEA5138771.1 aminotransferase class V-fold PLP-dependent enzyme [Arcicella rigui]
MTSRRNFISQVTALAGTSLLPTFKGLSSNDLHSIQQFSPSKSAQMMATDEDFWYQIQQAYTVSPQIINLNNGGVSPSPTVVQNAVERYNKFANEAPSYFMWRILDQGREPLRENLAKFSGVSSEEIAINRNATEALDTVILGLPLTRGDEIVLCKYDYPNMLHAWRQRELREGIKINYVEIDLPLENNDLIVQKYVEQMTPKTKVVHITHIVNWNGQIMPVKRIADEAHKRGIEVLIDGAHSFAHLMYKIPELGGDYFGTSLHKWLSAPIGSGMLWVKKEKISKIFPLIPNDKPNSDNIRKFENLGTRPFMIEQAIGQALNFQLAIGNARKEARLQFLKTYWTKEASKITKVKLNTPLKPEYSGALSHFSIEGMEAGKIESELFAKYKIHTTPVKWEKLDGVRVTPHVYTTLQDLDRLLEAINYLSKA